MKTQTSIIAVFFLICLSASTGYSQGKADQIYQEGLYEEEMNGDLDKAIVIYQRILNDFPQNRSIGAKAQLHIALCKEKLGMREAVQAYRDVIINYPEQKDEVAIAREKVARLAAIMEEELPSRYQGLTIRKIWPDLDIVVKNLGGPSPDGRYIVCVDPQGGDIALLNLENKEKNKITDNWSLSIEIENSGVTDEEKDSLYSTIKFCVGPVWSPDGTQIAYGRCSASEVDLCVYKIDNMENRIIPLPEGYKYAIPTDWSSDGENILICLLDEKMTSRYGLVSIKDGSLDDVKELITKKPYDVFLSSDSRYLIYSKPDENGSDIFLSSVDEDYEHHLVQNQAENLIIDWTPDGNHLLFLSNRTGSWDVWALGMKENMPAGDPRLIKKDIGEITPLGVTNDGSFYFGAVNELIDVFVAEVDLDNGEVISEPKRVTEEYIGSNTCPAWSPDGKYLAYVSIRRPGKSNAVVCIRSNETGEIDELNTDLNHLGPLSWYPDGRAILVSAQDGKGQKGIFKINVCTGDFTSVMMFEDPDERVLWTTWDPDQKKLFYKYRPKDDMYSRLMVYDPLEKKENELYRELSWPTFLALSPDGRFLAFQRMVQGVRTISIMPSEGGEPKDVVSLGKGRATSIAWAPDGKSLLYTRTTEENTSIRELMQISIDGGEPRKMGLEMERIWGLGINQNGKKIVFQSRQSSNEIWVMENFLPLVED